MSKTLKSALNSRANQLNPNSAAHEASRGESKAAPGSSNPSSEQSEQQGPSRPPQRQRSVRARGGRP